MKIGIVGYGVVGSAMCRFFQQHTDHELAIYDKFQTLYGDSTCQHAVNRADLVFLCVPTPTGPDGLSCDISAVQECLAWIDVPVCIRSTVPPGTTDRLFANTGKPIAFSPEYIGEQPGHPWRDELACGFLIVGGPQHICDLVRAAFRVQSDLSFVYHCTTARTAELCKYMENCFLATKVAFVNTFFDLAQAYDVDFQELRELWLLDPRIGPSHSSVTAERGFGGRCLPKDLTALIAEMRSSGRVALLEAVFSYNNRLREANRNHR
jgi:UDPglucose 6-dehydrogenase